MKINVSARQQLGIFLCITFFTAVSPTLAHPDHNDCTNGRPMPILQVEDRDCWCLTKSQQTGDIPVGCTADNTENILRSNFGAAFSDLAALLGTSHLNSLEAALPPLIAQIEKMLQNPYIEALDYPVSEACLIELKTLEQQLVDAGSIDSPSARCVMEVQELVSSGTVQLSAQDGIATEKPSINNNKEEPASFSLRNVFNQTAVVEAETTPLSFITRFLRALLGW